MASSTDKSAAAPEPAAEADEQDPGAKLAKTESKTAALAKAALVKTTTAGKKSAKAGKKAAMNVKSALDSASDIFAEFDLDGWATATPKSEV
eukprot:SAG11_NODE_25989_length_351_cov_0.805556_1_plen_91_part_01